MQYLMFEGNKMQGKSVFDSIEDCVLRDIADGKGEFVNGILVNESTLDLLYREGSITEFYRGEELEGDKTYFAYVDIAGKNLKLFTLPNYHPQIQKLFVELNQEPILKTDSQTEADRKRYAVHCTVDSDGDLIL